MSPKKRWKNLHPFRRLTSDQHCEAKKKGLFFFWIFMKLFMTLLCSLKRGCGILNTKRDEGEAKLVVGEGGHWEWDWL